MNYFLSILFGILSGVLGGMGLGGGTLLIPLLSLIGYTQHSAQAINLVSFLPMSAVALIFHIKNKLVDFEDVLFVIVPGLILSVVFSILASNVDGEKLSRVFGGFLILLSFVQFFADDIAKKSEN